MPGRLVLGLPLYTHVSTLWLIRYMELDKSSVVDTIAIRKLYLASAMNHMFKKAIESDSWDRIVVYEADMMPPRNALARIANYPDSLDVVGSMYFQHNPPHYPIAYEQVDEEHFKHLDGSQIDHMMSNPGLYPVDGIGFGFTSVHRRVIEKWDNNIDMFGGENHLGHDMWFCKNARAQGFSVHIDSAIECGHLTEMPINYNSVLAHASLGEKNG